MNDEITGEIMAQMLMQLSHSHFYGKNIVNLTTTLAPFIHTNKQLTKLLKRCAQQCDFQTNRIISWSNLDKDDRKIISCFFDYLYFTSPQFLKETG